MMCVPVVALWAVPWGVRRRWIIGTALSCVCGLSWVLPVDASANPTPALLATGFSGDSGCTMPGTDDRALARLRALSIELGSIRLAGLAPDVTSQLWMGMPLTMRAFVLSTTDAPSSESVVTRLSHAQPRLEDLAVTNDGFMLVGRDDDTQWAAHWQIMNGSARGWLSALALRLPASMSEARRGNRSEVMSWLPNDARMIAHYAHDLNGDMPQWQGVWQIMQPPIQAARSVARALARDGWVAQSSLVGPWHRGSCVLNFQVLDSLAVDNASALSAAVHSFLWALLQRAQP